MIDELHLTRFDLKMIQRGKTSGAVATLRRLRRRFRAVWVVTSTSCLLDITSESVRGKVKLGPVMYDATYSNV